MNYDAFMEPVTWFLTGEEKHSDEFKKERLNNTSFFWKSMKKAIGENFGNFSMYTSMNQLDNHDHSRFMTRTNMKPGRSSDAAGPEGANKGINKGIYKEATVLQMTWPGAPTLYYGDEAGVCGYTDPKSRYSLIALLMPFSMLSVQRSSLHGILCFQPSRWKWSFR